MSIKFISMSNEAISSQALVATGQTTDHLSDWGNRPVRVHSAIRSALDSLCQKAHRAGFELEVVSAYRGFDAQLSIWNEKARGQRPLLDSSGKPLEARNLSADGLVDAILIWSALPGASRHHWGTDLDVIDRLSVPPRYQVQLTPAEVGPGGMFCGLHDWLDRHMAKEGFFRPYQCDLGGVKPERWHISHAPTSQPLFEAHNVNWLRQAIESSQMELKDAVLARLDELFERYFLRVSAPA